MEISTLCGTLPLKTTAKAGLYKSVKIHLPVHQSWDSQCLQTCKYGYNTLHGACTSQRQLRSPAAVRDPESLTAPWLQFPESASISRWFGYKGSDSSWKKTSKLSSPLCQSRKKKNAIIQSITNSNLETLLMRKGTRLHVKDTICFY